MSIHAEREIRHLGETAGCEDHDHDLIHELSRRLDMVWRYDQYIANAEWRGHLKEFWEGMKVQEMENIRRLKQLLKEEMYQDCF